MAIQFNSSDTKKTAQLLQSRARKQLDAFYQKPYAVISAELLATITAVVFLSVFAIRPTLTTMSTLLKDLEDRKETHEVLRKKVATLSTLAAELPAVQSQVSRLDDSLPDSPRFDEVLLRIEYLASQNNVVVEGLRSNSVPKERISGSVDDGVVSFPITLNLTGSYENIVAFIEQLMTMDRIVKPDTALLQSELDPNTGFPSQTIKFSTNIQVFYRGIDQQSTQK